MEEFCSVHVRKSSYQLTRNALKFGRSPSGFQSTKTKSGNELKTENEKTLRLTRCAPARWWFRCATRSPVDPSWTARGTATRSDRRECCAAGAAESGTPRAGA